MKREKRNFQDKIYLGVWNTIPGKIDLFMLRNNKHLLDSDKIISTGHDQEYKVPFGSNDNEDVMYHRPYVIVLRYREETEAEMHERLQKLARVEKDKRTQLIATMAKLSEGLTWSDVLLEYEDYRNVDSKFMDWLKKNYYVPVKKNS